jgi:hypothetical protein
MIPKIDRNGTDGYEWKSIGLRGGFTSVLYRSLASGFF